VIRWVDLDRKHPNSGATGNGDADHRIVRDAVRAAEPWVDFASFDTDGDRVITASELHVTVIAAGYETGYTGGAPEAACGPGVWGHQWETFGRTPTVDGVKVGGDGGSYTLFGEWHCIAGSDQPGAMATIGIMVHELGHDLGWPDLYDADYSSAGVGDWSIMAGGTWSTLPGQRLGASPVHPDAWSKVAQGWVTPAHVKGQATGTAITQGVTAPSVFQMRPNPNGVDWSSASPGKGQYFLVENRQPVGYDAALPGCGLLVWHIDETRWDNSDDARRLVDLEQADGFADLDYGWPGDSGDPYPGSSKNMLFGPVSWPDSNLYSAAPSGVEIRPVTKGCGPVMAADLTGPGAPLTVPGLPTALTATAGRDADARVGFRAPLDNGATPVTGYTARCASTDGGVTRSVRGTASPIRVTRLDPGRTYRCRVRATNAVGDGPFAPATGNLVAVRPPDAPRKVAVTATRRAITATFKRPVSNGGSPVTSYDLKCTRSGGGPTFVASGPGSPLTVRGLTPGQPHRCVVRAVNAVGAGPFSSPALLVVTAP
jgi:M6 family metalloprotease-like protein